jgi:hypothetical protein
MPTTRMPNGGCLVNIPGIIRELNGGTRVPGKASEMHGSTETSLECRGMERVGRIAVRGDAKSRALVANPQVFVI